MPIKIKGDIKPKPLLATQYLSDTMLQAMEGEGDNTLQIIRVKRGRDPCYDLTKNDGDLKEACALVMEDILPTNEEEIDVDDLSVASYDTYDGIDVKEAQDLLIKLAETKAKEAEVLWDLAVVGLLFTEIDVLTA